MSGPSQGPENHGFPLRLSSASHWASVQGRPFPGPSPHLALFQSEFSEPLQDTSCPFLEPSLSSFLMA